MSQKKPKIKEPPKSYNTADESNVVILQGILPVNSFSGITYRIRKNGDVQLFTSAFGWCDTDFKSKKDLSKYNKKKV